MYSTKIIHFIFMKPWFVYFLLKLKKNTLQYLSTIFVK